jgi:anti-sigma B factor antagonist
MNIKEKNGVIVLELKGNLVGGSLFPHMERTLRNLIDQGKKNIVLDLGNIKFFNSSGIGILISSYTKVRENGGILKLANISTNFEGQLSSTKLNLVFENYSTVEEAINSF